MASDVDPVDFAEDFVRHYYGSPGIAAVSAFLGALPLETKMQIGDGWFSAHELAQEIWVAHDILDIVHPTRLDDDPSHSGGISGE